MAVATRQVLTNSQVSLHWTAPRRRGGALSRGLALLRLWRLRIQQRTELARLDARNLRDIGQSDGDVYREVAKWFWQE